MIIQIDDREPKEIREYFSRLSIKTDSAHLLVGDFTDGKTIIERKTFSDFCGSVFDGRIFEQCQNMRANYESAYIIISGLADFSAIEKSRHAILAAMSSIAVNFKIPVLMVSTDEDLVYVAYKIFEKSSNIKESINIVRLKVLDGDRKIMALTAAEGIGIKKACKIIEFFGDISAICNASKEALMTCDGIGNNLAENLKKIFK